MFVYGFYSDLVRVQRSGSLFTLGTRIHCWPTPFEYVYNSITLRYGEIGRVIVEIFVHLCSAACRFCCGLKLLVEACFSVLLFLTKSS